MVNTLNESYFDELMLSHRQPSRISHADGYVSLDENGDATFYYYLTDHLGNVRSVITPDTDGKPQVEQANDYFPFGMSFESRIPLLTKSGSGSNKHKYNGKEEQEMPGKWLDFHARFYDPAIVRTTTQDPMAESFLSESPYSFMENNPVVNIDPTGMSATRYEDEQGKLLLDTDDGSDAVVTVTDDKREGFDAAVKGTEDTDDVAWNNTMKKSMLGFELSGEQEGLLSQLNSDWSKKNAIAYWQNPTAGNAVAFAFSEALSQWTNPELVVLGLSAGAAGLSSVPKTAKALSTNPKTSVGPIKGYTKHGLNQAISRNGGRGVNASAMKDAVMNPKKIIQQSGGRTKYVGNKATVILNSEGKVITTYGKSRGPVN